MASDPAAPMNLAANKQSVHTSCSSARLVRWSMLAFAVTSLGCSVIADADRVQCSQTSDCTRRGPAFVNAVCVDSTCVADERWGCLGEKTEPSTQIAPYKVVLPLLDVVSNLPLPGIKGKLCYKLDLDCAQPAAEGAVSDAVGHIEFDVPARFDGYVQVEGEQISPALYFFNPPVDRDIQVSNVPLTDPRALAGLVAAVAPGASLTDRGLILLAALDCQGRAAAGVTFTSSLKDSAIVPYYSVGRSPVPGGVPETDVTGYGGLVNVPAGSLVVDGFLNADSRPLGPISLFVRPGYMTQSRMVPFGQ